MLRIDSTLLRKSSEYVIQDIITKKNYFSYIPLFSAIYALQRQLYATSPSVPKIHRYTVWQRTVDHCLKLIEMILPLGHCPKDQVLSRLQALSDQLDLLKVFIRLAFDTKAINPKQHAHFQEQLDTIGKMLGGWIRSLSPPPSAQ